MVDKIENWNPTCERYVAFLDIMGFKDRLIRDGHDEVKKQLELLKTAIKTIEDEISKPEARKLVKSKEKDNAVPQSSIVFPITFSDSIILVSYDNTDISALYTFGSVVMILGVAFEHNIPIKGAIACGKMTADIENSLYFGEPLIDAFELQKELQFYGVVLHHTCERHVHHTKLLGDKNIIQYLVPMKSGEIKHYILNWTCLFEKERDNPENMVSSLYNSVSGKPRMYVDNTIKFVREIAKKQEEGNQKQKPV